MTDYLLSHGTRKTPQSEAMRSDQVPNSAGGFSWEVDKWTKLRRFLILGSEGGSYYASQKDLTKENVTSLRECIAEDGLRTVKEIVAISDGGRAAKNDPALYALAAAFSLGDKETRLAAGIALPQVARIGTHLYHFVAYMETMRGWGRMARKAISEWYAKNPDQLALQAVKYRSRDGWSHRDLLRLSHPKNDLNAPIFDWIAHNDKSTQAHTERSGPVLTDVPVLIQGFEKAQTAISASQTAALVREYNLPREALLTEHLTDKDVWAALLESGMPMHAMTRNLANMTRVGILDSKDHRALILDALGNRDAIKKSRLHPLALLVALKTYAEGRGFRGTNTWTPLPSITDALDEAFYLAFDNVEPTGKSHLLALDVSGSMGAGNVAGSPLTPREAAAAMALVTLHVEDDVEVIGFFCGEGGYAKSGGRGVHYGYRDGVTPLGFSRRQRLDDAVRMTASLPFGGTDCALPFLYADVENKEFDAVIVYTDSETWAGDIHPKQALDDYRNKSGIATRSVVVGMVSSGFSIADPTDAGMLDVVGMDSATPALISEFVSGKI